MSKIIVVGGGKGGVGKSTVVMAAVDALIETGNKVVVVESDDSNPDVYKSLNKITKCEICNLDNEDGYMRLANIIEANSGAYIVVNTAARATDSLIKNCGVIDAVASALKRPLVMLWPMNRQRDSIELLKLFLDGQKGYSDVYGVINTYFGEAENFTRWESSKQKERVTGTIVFPDLIDRVADKIIDHRLALSNADEHLSIAERFKLSCYREEVKAALKVAF